MKVHVLFLALVVALTAALIGCGGKGGDNHNKGTLDPRIVGSWRPRTITYSGQTVNCPGEIAQDGNTVTCTDTVSQFTADGVETTGTTTNDYYFDGTTLFIYGDHGASTLATFSADGNQMTWSYPLNNQTVTAVLDRVVL